MCKITETKSEIKVGYKMVIERRGRFFSSFTGQEIKVDKVLMPPEIYKPKRFFWNTRWKNTEFSRTPFYNKDFVGKTGLFINLGDLRKTFLYGDLFIIKVTLSGEVFEGEYDWYPIIAGDTIESIEPLGPL